MFAHRTPETGATERRGPIRSKPIGRRANREAGQSGGGPIGRRANREVDQSGGGPIRRERGAPHALADSEARHRVGDAHVLVVNEGGLHGCLPAAVAPLHGADEPRGVVLLHPLRRVHHRLARVVDAFGDGVVVVALLHPAAPPEDVVAGAARHGELAHPVDRLRGGLAVNIHRQRVRQQPVPGNGHAGVTEVSEMDATADGTRRERVGFIRVA
eukprot:3250766-Pyramimonas_sp.AAC.1